MGNAAARVGLGRSHCVQLVQKVDCLLAAGVLFACATGGAGRAGLDYWRRRLPVSVRRDGTTARYVRTVTHAVTLLVATDAVGSELRVGLRRATVPKPRI